MDGKLKVLLCGCGGISSAWLKPAAGIEDIQIVGLVDIDAGRAGHTQSYRTADTLTTSDATGRPSSREGSERRPLSMPTSTSARTSADSATR